MILAHFILNPTSVLLKDDQLEGICFVNSNGFLANIPLIGLKRVHRGKGYGKYLLRNSLLSLMNFIRQGLAINAINAAVETDNYPALKMYRRIGFREDFTYPHAYYNNPVYKG